MNDEIKQIDDEQWQRAAFMNGVALILGLMQNKKVRETICSNIDQLGAVEMLNRVFEKWHLEEETLVLNFRSMLDSLKLIFIGLDLPEPKFN